jgi:cell division protein FtsQ
VRKTYSSNGQGTTALDDGLYGDEMLMEEERPRPSRRTRASSRLEELNARDLEIAEPQEDREPARGRRLTAKRKSLLPETTAGRIVLGATGLVVLATLAAAGYMVREFFRLDPRFRVASSEQIGVQGTQHVTADEVRDAFGEDMGRNLFFIPLRERQKQLESLPWVEHASVERLLPDRIAVVVKERTPVAFAQDGNRIRLIDRYGVLLDPSLGAETQSYSFPVLQGVGADVTPSTRRARMQLYERFITDVDGGGEKVSSRLSEVDINDPEDVQAVIPEGGAAYLVHFGDEKFQERYQMYRAHLAEWKGQYPKLATVDLRNEPQVVLGMGKAHEGGGDGTSAVAAKAPVPTPAATKPAVAAAKASVSKAKSGASAANKSKAAKGSAAAKNVAGNGTESSGSGAIPSAAPAPVAASTAPGTKKPGLHLHATTPATTTVSAGGQQ